MRLFRQLVNFVKDVEGPTAVEYAVMLGLVILVCFAAIVIIGTETKNNLTQPGQAFGS